jgi:hypothetical protein
MRLTGLAPCRNPRREDPDRTGVVGPRRDNLHDPHERCNLWHSIPFREVHDQPTTPTYEEDVGGSSPSSPTITSPYWRTSWRADVVTENESRESEAQARSDRR